MWLLFCFVLFLSHEEIIDIYQCIVDCQHFLNNLYLALSIIPHICFKPKRALLCFFVSIPYKENNNNKKTKIKRN